MSIPNFVKITELQLLKCHKFWSTELIRGNYVEIIYFDFAKAFDTVNRPLIKLKCYGITGNLLNWISFYLNVTLKISIRK